MTKMKINGQYVIAKYIKVMAQVRHWKSSYINEEEAKEDGSNVPFKNGKLWCPVIDIQKGKVLNWPKETTAFFHFKICDAGSYYLLDEDMNQIAEIENDYVPDGLCHGDKGYGDYIIFKVNSEGMIENYRNLISIEEWIEDEDEDY